MKSSIYLSVIVSLLFTVTSCQENVSGNTQDNSRAQKNIAAFKVVSDAFDSGDASKIDSVVASDFVDHTERGEVKGVDSLKAAITMMHAHIKDMKSETVHIVADDDYVFAWMKMSGTADGSMGMPSGSFSMSAVDVVKFNNDSKAVEHWSFLDPGDMMEMMHSMQGSMPMADSTKK